MSVNSRASRQKASVTSNPTTRPVIAQTETARVDDKCVRNAAGEIDQKGRMPRAEQSPVDPEGMQSTRGVHFDGPYKTKWGATSQGLQPAAARRCDLKVDNSTAAKNDLIRLYGEHLASRPIQV